MMDILREKKASFNNIKEVVKDTLISQDKWIPFPDFYTYQGYRISFEDLSIIVFYNGVKYHIKTKTKEVLMPTYNGKYFPWEIKDGQWVFVDNNNNYASKIIEVLRGDENYQE